MATPNWQILTPLEAIIFDCDGTLSAIEGIDELAKKNGVGQQVSSLTEEAMGKTGLNLSLYKKRLDLVRPTHEQVIGLGMEYYANRIPDIDAVLSVLTRLNKMVYIVSAGLTPSVTIFGQLLQIPPSHIFAVNLDFDDQGHFLDFDHKSPLVTKEGKRLIVTQLKTRYDNLAYIGDGLNDYAVYDLVTRFIGYGGIFYRENIAALCSYYIKTKLLASLLPLILTETEAKNLLSSEQKLYDQGVEAIQKQQVLVPE
jgi:phosphoserine phosphatase